jgi:hypothetical protein
MDNTTKSEMLYNHNTARTGLNRMMRMLNLRLTSAFARNAKNAFLLFLLACSPSFLNAQAAKPSPITDQDFYDFFNTSDNPYPVSAMIGQCNPDSLKTCNLISTPEYGVLQEDTTQIFQDTLFSIADRAYIRQQCINLRNRQFQWKNGMLKGIKVIDGARVRQVFDSAGADSGWTAYYHIFRQGYNKFSVPLFSLDKTKCIVYRGFECGHTGIGNTNAFVKKNTKWVLALSCGPWVH